MSPISSQPSSCLLQNDILGFTDELASVLLAKKDPEKERLIPPGESKKEPETKSEDVKASVTDESATKKVSVV